MTTTQTTTDSTSPIPPVIPQPPKGTGVAYLNWALAWKPTGKRVRGDMAKHFVLVILAMHANADGVCWPSQATLARETRLCVKEVQRILVKLENDGLITRRHRKDPKTGERTSDVYHLNMPVAPSTSVH